MMALVHDAYDDGDDGDGDDGDSDDGDGADSDGADEHLLGGQLFQGRQNSPPKSQKMVIIKTCDFYQVSNGSI